MTRDPRAAAVAVSAALHVLVLAWLAQGALARLAAPPPADARVMTVELDRLRPQEAIPARTPAPLVAEARPSEAPLAPARPMPAVTPSPLRAAPLPPSPLAPLTSPAAPPAPARGPALGPAAAPSAPAAVRPAGEANFGGLLRQAVGCSHEVWMRLSQAERDRCGEGFATAARRGEKFPLPTDKLAAYAAQADANERNRAGREGSLPNTLPPCDPGMVGSNLMPTCLPKEAMHTVAKF